MEDINDVSKQKGAAMGPKGRSTETAERGFGQHKGGK